MVKYFILIFLEEDMKGKFKRIMACAMAMAVTSTLLFGCAGKKDKKDSDVVYTKEEASTTKAMVIGDYDVYMDELVIYAIQEITLYGVTPDMIEADEKTYKDQTLALVRETKILYDVALHNNVELNDDDIAARDKLINSFKSVVPEEVFEKYGISDEVIEKVFTERTYVEKFENDIRNQMGQDISKDLADGFKDYNFQKLYYMVFPTIEVDDDGNPATDTDGNYIEVSDDKKEEAKENAKNASDEINSGKDCKEVAENYGVSTFCSEMNGYVGAYSDEMNEALDKLSAGECTDIIDSEVGYVIIAVISDHDEELKENYIYSVANDYLSDQYQSLRNDWLASIPVDVEKDMEGDVWEKFDMKDLSQMLNDAGIVMPTVPQ